MIPFLILGKGRGIEQKIGGKKRRTRKGKFLERY